MKRSDSSEGFVYMPLFEFRNFSATATRWSRNKIARIPFSSELLRACRDGAASKKVAGFKKWDLSKRRVAVTLHPVSTVSHETDNTI